MQPKNTVICDTEKSFCFCFYNLQIKTSKTHQNKLHNNQIFDANIKKTKIYEKEFIQKQIASFAVKMEKKNQSIQQTFS